MQISTTESAPGRPQPGAHCLNSRAIWIATGLLLLGLNAAVVALSGDFGPHLPSSDQPIAWFVGIELAAGMVFFLVAAAMVRQKLGSLPLSWLVFVGLVVRGAMMCSTPILEHDYYRYLWDGAVLAHGVNPFRYAPAQIASSAAHLPSALLALAGESGDLLSKINHPELRTIYPPVAQVAFALAYAIEPWSLTAWRCVLACCDAVTTVMLVLILRNLRLPLCLLVLYWWNPLVVREIYNTGHMDVLALPFVLSAVMLSVRGANLGATAVLALAVGAKLWPIVLLPVILSPLWRNPKQLFACSAVFTGMVLLLFAPVLVGGLDADSGFVSYGLHWRVNGSLFSLISVAIRTILDALSLTTVPGHMVTRVVVACVMLCWMAWQCRSVPASPPDWWHRCLLIVAAVFLLAPAGFPWYYLWVVPFLTVRPTISLLLLNCLLPLYYLVFLYRPRGEGEFFDSFIVWIEYLPVAGALIYEWLAPRSAA